MKTITKLIIVFVMLLTIALLPARADTAQSLDHSMAQLLYLLGGASTGNADMLMKLESAPVQPPLQNQIIEYCQNYAGKNYTKPRDRVNVYNECKRYYFKQYNLN